MARKLSLLLSLAAVTAVVAFLLTIGGNPQVGFAGQAPDPPADPGTEVIGKVITTNEDVKVDVPLGASHDDGALGCTELLFSTSDDTNGTVGDITNRDCNTTELSADVLAAGFYRPAASEDGAGAGTCSDGIDNDSDGADEDDTDCLLDILPVASTLGFPSSGVVEIDDELIFFSSLGQAGSTACGGDGSDPASSSPCLIKGLRADIKTTAADHADGSTVVFRSELGSSGEFGNLTSAATLTSPAKDEALDVDSVSGFPTTRGVVIVDDELIIYVGVETTVDANCLVAAPCFLNVHRGALGTAVAAHASGATVISTVPSFVSLTEVETDIDGPPQPDTIIRVDDAGAFAGNGGVIQIGKEMMTYEQVSQTLTDCGSPDPASINPDVGCLTGVVRGAFDTNPAPHVDGTFIFTVGGDDIDQATANFTPANNYFNNGKAAKTQVEDEDTGNPVDETSTVLPVVSTSNFDPAGGLITIDGSETASYTSLGSTDADCAPFSAPCLLGLVRGLVGTTEIDPDDGDQVTQLGGSAGFFYTVGKGGLDSVPQLVEIDVIAVNDPPVAAAKVTVVLEQASTENDPAKKNKVQTSIVLIVTDVDSCGLVFTVDETGGDGPSEGTIKSSDVTIFSPPKVDCTSVPPDTDKDPNIHIAKMNYLPDSDFDGSDSFTVTVHDQNFGDPGDKDAKGEITIEVNIVNTLPTAGPVDKVTAQADGTETIVITGSDPDVAASGAPHCELNFSMVSFPENGNLSIIGSGFLVNNKCEPGSPNTDSAVVVYTPNSGYVGPDTFTYRVDDRTGNGDSISVVKVEINVVGAAPPGLKFGDVNCDTVVDPLDALQILLWSAGLQTDQEPGCPQIGSQ